jgi:hypothetical protein
MERAERAGQASRETSGEIADAYLDVIACDKREAFAPPNASVPLMAAALMNI